MSNRTVIKTGVTNILGDTVADVIIPVSKLTTAPQATRVLDATDKRTKGILDNLSNKYTLSMTNYIYQRNRLLLNQLKKQLHDMSKSHNPIDKKKALSAVNAQVKKFNYSIGLRKLLNNLWDSAWFAGAGEALKIVKRDKAAFEASYSDIVEFAGDIPQEDRIKIQQYRNKETELFNRAKELERNKTNIANERALKKLEQNPNQDFAQLYNAESAKLDADISNLKKASNVQAKRANNIAAKYDDAYSNKRTPKAIKSDNPVKTKSNKFADLPKDEQARRKLSEQEKVALRNKGDKPFLDKRRVDDSATPVDRDAAQKRIDAKKYKEQTIENNRELKKADKELKQLRKPGTEEGDLIYKIENKKDKAGYALSDKDIEAAKARLNEINPGRIKALEQAKVRRTKLIQQKANLEANARDKTPITQTDFGSAYISKRNGQISDNYEKAYQQQVTNLIAQYANGIITEQQLFDSLSGTPPFGVNNKGVVDSEAYKKVPHNVSQRVGRIARTEVVAAFNIGKLDKLYQQGYEEVEWCAVLETETCGLCSDRNGTIYKIDELLNQLDPGRFPSRSEKDNWEYIIIPCHPSCNCVFKPVGDMEEEERNRRRRKVNKQRSNTTLKATAFATTGAISLGLIYAGLLAYRGKLKINKKSVQQIQERVQAVQQEAVEKQVNIPLSTTISNAANQVDQTTPESVKRTIAEQLLNIPKQQIQEQVPIDLRPTVNIPEPELDIVDQPQLNLVQENIARISTNLEERKDDGASSTYEPNQNIIKASNNLAVRANKQIVIANNILSKNALDNINNMQLQANDIINLLSQNPNDVNTAMRGIELLKDMNNNYILAAQTNDVALKHIQLNLALVRDELIVKLGEQYSIDIAPVNLDTAAILKATRPYRQVQDSFDNAQRLRNAYETELPNRLNILDAVKQRLVEVPAVKYLYKAEQRGQLEEFNKWLKSKDTVNKVSNKYQLNYYKTNVLRGIEEIVNSGIPIDKREYDEYMRQLYIINNDVIEKSKKYNVDIDFISNNIKRENLSLEPPINPLKVEKQLNTYREYQQLYNEISNKTHDLTIRMKDMQINGNFRVSYKNIALFKKNIYTFNSIGYN